MSTPAARPASPVPYAVVVPSIGRPSLDRHLETLVARRGEAGAAGPAEVVVADDRRLPPAGSAGPVPAPLDLGAAGERLGARVVRAPRTSSQPASRTRSARSASSR